MIDIERMIMGLLFFMVMMLSKYVLTRCGFKDTEAWFVVIACWLGVMAAHINAIEKFLGI